MGEGRGEPGAGEVHLRSRHGGRVCRGVETREGESREEKKKKNKTKKKETTPQTTQPQSTVSADPPCPVATRKQPEGTG